MNLPAAIGAANSRGPPRRQVPPALLLGQWHGYPPRVTGALPACDINEQAFSSRKRAIQRPVPMSIGDLTHEPPGEPHRIIGVQIVAKRPGMRSQAPTQFGPARGSVQEGRLASGDAEFTECVQRPLFGGRCLLRARHVRGYGGYRGQGHMGMIGGLSLPWFF